MVFFGKHLDGGEMRGKAGALKLVGLFFRVAFGDHDEAMACGEIGESWSDVGEEFDLLVGDGLSEALDAAVLLGCEWDIGEVLETGDERAAKAVEAVAVGMNGGVLDTIEVATDFFGRVDAMVEVGDEAGDGPFEVDVVFPESVVGVDEQGLVRTAAKRLGRRLLGEGHRLIIRRFWRASVTKVRCPCHAWGMYTPDWVCQIKRQ